MLHQFVVLTHDLAGDEVADVFGHPGGSMRWMGVCLFLRLPPQAKVDEEPERLRQVAGVDIMTVEEGLH